jgi:hypothetical protein
MKMLLLKRSLIISMLVLWLAACVGTQSFTTAARPGETVALAVGWQKKLSRQNVTVTITPSSGSPVTYPPNDPKVRAIVNMYPDPASRAVVGTMTGQDLDYCADACTGALIKAVSSDNDWWQTVMMLDLPSTFPSGAATVSITDSAGAVIQPIYIDILPGTSASNLFTVYNTWGSVTPLLQYWPDLLRSMERADRYTVTFASSGVIPHSIQVEFTRTPGVGVTWVVNPRGDIKNVAWTDDGTRIKVLLTPTVGETLSQLLDYKFYIAGGIAGLTQTNLKAYDVNGNPVSGITANVQFSN